VIDRAEVADDLEYFGAPAALVEKYRGTAACPDDVEVHSDNVAAFILFNALGSQWRIAVLPGMGVSMVQKTGLDYGAAESVARIMNITLDKDNFGRLRILENAALAAWGEDFARSVRK
jgi:hypothetical protein